MPITFHRIFEQAALDGIIVYHENMRGHFWLRFPVYGPASCGPLWRTLAREI
jgi:hypothetical protein